MDREPYRTDRRVINGAASEQPAAPVVQQPYEAPAETPTAPREVSRPTQRTTSAPHHAAKKKKSFKRFIISGVIAIIIVVLAIVGYSMLSNKGNANLDIDKSAYQAVFFTNGQIYFGKLQPLNDDSMKLTDIYYLQAQTTDTSDSSTLQKTATDQNNVQLIKLGAEIHGPTDEMVISKKQILFYENLKDDGKVVKSIIKYKDTAK